MKSLVRWFGFGLLVMVVVIAGRRFVPAGDTTAIEALAAAKTGAVLVDVRSIGERRQGAVPGSIHAPWTEVVPSLAAQGIRPDQPVVLYCAVGSRSHAAALKLREAGYTNIRQVKGGHRDLMQALDGG